MVANGFAVDETSVYCTGLFEGVRKVPKTGGAVENRGGLRGRFDGGTRVEQ